MNTNPDSPVVSSSEGAQPSESVNPESSQSTATIDAPVEVIQTKRPTHSRRPSELLKTVKAMNPGDTHFVACTEENQARQMRLAWSMGTRLKKRYGSIIHIRRIEGGFNVEKSNLIRLPKVNKVKFASMPFKIEKGIPVPPAANAPGGRDGIFPIRHLKVGDSFFVPCTKKEVAKRQQRLTTAIYNWARKRKGFKGTTRRIAKGIRVWRIA